MLDLDRFLENPLAQREVLLAEEIRRAGIELQAGRQGDRPERAMRRNHYVVNLGHRGNFARLEDAADMREVRLDNRHRLTVQQIAEVPARKQTLASGDWNGRGLFDLPHRPWVGRQHGFLNEHRAKRLERAAKLLCHRRSAAAVKIKRHVDVIAQRLAEIRHSLDNLVDETRCLDRLAGWHGHEFVGREIPVAHRFGHL